MTRSPARRGGALARRHLPDHQIVDAEVLGELCWDDLLEIKGIGPKTVQRIKTFCDQSDPFALAWTARVMSTLREQLAPGNEYGLPTPTHTSSTLPREGEHYDLVFAGIPRKKKFGDYIEDQRSRTGKTIEEIKAEMKDPHLSRRALIECYDDYDEDVFCRFNRWKLPQFIDDIEQLKCDGSEAILVTGMRRQTFGVSLHVQDLWVLSLEDD